MKSRHLSPRQSAIVRSGLEWKTLEWSERITLVSPDSLHILQKQFVNLGGDWMNNKRLLAVVASACLAMLAQPAMAAKGFNYSYAEAGYRTVDVDDESEARRIVEFILGFRLLLLECAAEAVTDERRYFSEPLFCEDISWADQENCQQYSNHQYASLTRYCTRSLVYSENSYCRCPADAGRIRRCRIE